MQYISYLHFFQQWRFNESQLYCTPTVNGVACAFTVDPFSRWVLCLCATSLVQIDRLIFEQPQGHSVWRIKRCISHCKTNTYCEFRSGLFTCRTRKIWNRYKSLWSLKLSWHILQIWYCSNANMLCKCHAGNTGVNISNRYLYDLPKS